MTAHHLFPTLVTDELYPHNNNFKKIFYKNIFKYMNHDGISNESTNHVNLHHEEEFAELFKFISNSAREHIKKLELDPDIFVYNIVKSWMNITKEYNTPRHNHADAHLSFGYYINIPINCDTAIRFFNENQRNDLFSSMILVNEPKCWNYVNAYSLQFMPKEGQVFLFPAKLTHDTIGTNLKDGGGSSFEKGIKNIEELSQYRICLAGDIMLTYKNRMSRPLGLQPVEDWRSFS